MNIRAGYHIQGKQHNLLQHRVSLKLRGMLIVVLKKKKQTNSTHTFTYLCFSLFMNMCVYTGVCMLINLTTGNLTKKKKKEREGGRRDP